jgi:hypothetical protein
LRKGQDWYYNIGIIAGIQKNNLGVKTIV